MFQEKIIPLQDVPVLVPHPANPGGLEEEASPGPAVDPVSLPSDPGSCSFPMPPGARARSKRLHLRLARVPTVIFAGRGWSQLALLLKWEPEPTPVCAPSAPSLPHLAGPGRSAVLCVFSPASRSPERQRSGRT